MLKGIICPYDSSYQSFDVCIHAHENGGQRNCDCPIELLKAMRDNHITRKHAGWSMSTLLGCARAVALREKYDFYESITSGWNKSRGTWLHAMFESDETSPDDVVKEKRLGKDVHTRGRVVRITGKPDYTATQRGILIDYKSKHTLPTRPDPSHEAQFNGYAWLWNGGYYINDDGSKGESVHVLIKSGGMFYVTWHTKEGSQFKKMGYPVWSLERTEAFIIKRLEPLLEWQETGVLPKCNAYQTFPGKWRCDCVKLEEQLMELGTYAEY